MFIAFILENAVEIEEHFIFVKCISSVPVRNRKGEECAMAGVSDGTWTIPRVMTSSHQG